MQRIHSRGFTLVELMVVVAIAAVIGSLAVPSFSGYVVKNRVAGVLAELVGDIQLARTEAVQRNAVVRISFGTRCYVLHTVGTSATSCTQGSANTVGTGAVVIKTVHFDAASTASLSPRDSLTYLQFDNIRSMASWDATSYPAGSAAIDVTSSVGSWQLRASTTAVGRVRACSPNGSVPGYSSTSC